MSLHKLALTLVLLACPIVAQAKPVYLSCPFVTDGKAQPRKFTVDEEASQVTIIYPETVESQVVRAGFSADTVTFETYVYRYALIRAKPIAVRQDNLTKRVDQVDCTIEQPAQRAF